MIPVFTSHQDIAQQYIDKVYTRC